MRALAPNAKVSVMLCLIATLAWDIVGLRYSHFGQVRDRLQLVKVANHRAAGDEEES